MILNELLAEHNRKMSNELADILIISIKKVFPLYYDVANAQGWSNYKIANQIASMDLEEKDLFEITKHAVRLSKIWAFS